jgi:hypothetical protein
MPRSTTAALRRRGLFRPGPAPSNIHTYAPELQAAVRQAEAGLEAAAKQTEVKAAAKRLMRAKEALKAAEEEAGATRRAASRGAAKAGAS